MRAPLVALSLVAATLVPLAHADEAEDSIDRIEPFEPRAQTAVVRFDPPDQVPIWGPRYAPVTIEFFYDPRTYYYNRAKAYRLLEQLRERHPRRLRVVFRIYSQSTSDTFMAEALAEAFAQGKFFEMAALTHNGRLRRKSDLITRLKEIGMNVAALEAAWRDGRHLELIKRNASRRDRLKVRRSSYHFLTFNGVPHKTNAYSVNLDQLENLYDAAYAQAKKELDRGIPLSRLYPYLLRKLETTVDPVRIRRGRVDGEKPKRWRRSNPIIRRPRLIAGKVAGKAVLGRGPVDAPVQVTLFCSLQSRNCAQLGALLEEVRKIYPDRLRVSFRHLFDDEDSDQPSARLVAEAAMCANEQGGFWRFYDQAVQRLRWRSRVGAVSVGQLKSWAKFSNIDVTDFAKCLESARHAAAVERDLRAARNAGITKTPSLMVGGHLYEGTKTSPELKYLINQELRPGLLERLTPALHD